MTNFGRLKRLRVDGFRSIKHLDLDLRPLNVLIGSNGAGKSVFISVFRFLNSILEKDLQLYVAKQGGAEKLLHFGRKVTEAIEIYLDFSPSTYFCRLVPTASGTLVFEREEWEFKEKTKSSEAHDKVTWPLTPGATESQLPVRPEASLPTGRVVRIMRGWKIYHFHDTSESAKVKQSGNIRDVDALRTDAGNLAAFLLSIRDSPSYEKIIATIQRVAPFFQDFILEPDSANPDFVRLRWKHRGTDAYFDANDLSDGTLRFICLATLLLQPELPTIILLDEPELGLHPYAIQLLASMIRSTSSSTQIITSTQSVTLANQFEHQDLIVVDRVNESSHFRRLSESEVKPWLDEYALGDLWEKNLIGGTP